MKIKLLNEHAVVPTYGSDKAAWADLYAAIEKDLYINPHETVIIGTGIAMEIPDGYFGAIFARSGLASKQGLRPANAVGVIDSDYRGEVKVALHNDTNDTQMVQAGSRIAQLIILPYKPVTFEIVDDLDETDRGDQGFGSTGIK